MQNTTLQQDPDEDQRLCGFLCEMRRVLALIDVDRRILGHLTLVRTNGSVGGDSSAMTVEFLRARLLAERSVSRTARQRADELAKRVVELEEQLKIVSLQRKKAEKATADVLAILENRGLSDFSEEVDSSSDQEINHFETKIGHNFHEEESLVGSEIGRNRRDDLSGSEMETSSLPGRSLSWKSGKDSPSSGGKKYVDSSSKVRSSFASPSFSSTRRSASGKSCRQIRQRESRSADKEPIKKASPENGDAACIEGHPTNSGSATEIPGNNSENQKLIVIEGSGDLENRQLEALSGSPLGVHNSNREMKRALEHQAQLVGQYEEEEKAQREWEDRFRENNSSPVSCERGTTRSDITEERDETKTNSAPYFVRSNDSVEFEAKSNIKSVLMTAQSSSTSKHCDNQPSPLQPDMRYFQDRDNNSSTMPVSLFKGETTSGRNIRSHDSMPHEVPAVLEALQQAKLSLNLKLKASPRLNGGSQIKAIEFPAKDRPEVPVGCDALFRVPSDFYLVQNNNPLASGSRLSLANYYPNDETALNSPNQLITSRSTETWPRFPSIKPHSGSSLDAGLSHPNNFAYGSLNINGDVQARFDSSVPFPSPYLYNSQNMDMSKIRSSYVHPTYTSNTVPMSRMPYVGKPPFSSMDMNLVPVRQPSGGERPYTSTDINHLPSSYASPMYPLSRDPMLHMPSGGGRSFSSSGNGVGRSNLAFYDHINPNMYR